MSHNDSLDVLSEPDDSYPIRESNKTRKTKDAVGPSGGIGVFFSKRPASEEDIVMNEGGTATVNVESADDE